MPVLALNSGRIRPNSPESCVEVVEETTIDFSAFARAGETASRATKAPMTVSSRDITRILRSDGVASPVDHSLAVSLLSRLAHRAGLVTPRQRFALCGQSHRRPLARTRDAQLGRAPRPGQRKTIFW